MLIYDELRQGNKNRKKKINTLHMVCWRHQKVSECRHKDFKENVKN